MYQIAEKGKAYLPLIQSAAARFGVPWPLLSAQLQQESDFNPDAVSSAGAQGIAQFMPATAAEYGLMNPFDPHQAIPAQAHYMADLYAQFHNWSQALAAYNAGPTAVANAVLNDPDNWLAALPNETQNYVSVITGNAGIA